MREPALVLLALVAACVNRPYLPASPDDMPFLERAQEASDGALTVRVAVPSREEADALFGLRLSDRGIQPVWVEIENEGDERVRFAPVGMDDDYFSPFEIAYMFRGGFSPDARRQMEARFHETAMTRRIEAGEVRSGFVFTHARPGTKIVNVDLYGTRDQSFTFFLRS